MNELTLLLGLDDDELVEAALRRVLQSCAPEAVRGAKVSHPRGM